MAWVTLAGTGTAGAMQAGDPSFRQTSVGEQLRQNLNALAARRAVYPLGGSRNQALQHNAVIDAYDYLDIELDGTLFLTGATVRARVEVRVQNAATSVTPQIYNVTDASVTVTGAACTATDADYSGANQRQTLSFTPVTGVKKYRLRFTPSNNTWPFWGIGMVEVFF